jgi:hypothetical protein
LLQVDPKEFVILKKACNSDWLCIGDGYAITSSILSWSTLEESINSFDDYISRLERSSVPLRGLWRSRMIKRLNSATDGAGTPEGDPYNFILQMDFLIWRKEKRVAPHGSDCKHSAISSRHAVRTSLKSKTWLSSTSRYRCYFVRSARSLLRNRARVIFYRTQ